MSACQHISAGSVSVFEVGIGFSVFFRFFQKSVRFSVSVFQNIAISVRFFGFIYLFANLHVGAQLIRYCTSEAHVHTGLHDTSSFSSWIHAVLGFFQKQVWYVISMSPCSNEFQTVGPHEGKARGPKVIVLVRDTVNSRCATERKNYDSIDNYSKLLTVGYFAQSIKIEYLYYNE